MDHNTPKYGILETWVNAQGKLTWLETNKVPQRAEADLKYQLQKAQLLNQITQAKVWITQEIFQVVKQTLVNKMANFDFDVILELIS